MSDSPPWIQVDMRGIRARTIGAARGLSPATERRWRTLALRARDEVRDAHREAVLPHGRWWAESSVEPHEVSLPLLVLGEPGAVRATTLGVPSPQVQTSSWERDFDGMTIRVDGAPHLPGTGDLNEDLRFGAFGPVAAGIRRAVLGADTAAAVDAAIASAATACAEAVGDPALDLTAALSPAAFDAAGVVLFATPEVMSFARWWAGVLSAVTCKPSSDGASRVARGLSVQAVELGDEASLQAALHADPAALVVTVSTRRERSDVSAVREALRATVLRAGHPCLDVRLAGSEAHHLLPAAWVALEGALATAVAVGVEPLTLIPGEDLRMQLDSGGGEPT